MIPVPAADTSPPASPDLAEGPGWGYVTKSAAEDFRGVEKLRRRIEHRGMAMLYLLGSVVLGVWA